MFSKKIAIFLDELKEINWFGHSGIPNKKYYMIFSLYKACDSWGKDHYEVWEANSYKLEDIACEKIGDDKIDKVFDMVSASIGDIVWNKFGEFITRQHLEEEMGVCDELFDMVKRDIAWACIEKILDMPGFFTILTEIYKEGYFPCAWIGEYPSGQVVVL